MSLKYRIRLHNDRVIGPFTTEEIGELYSKKHIIGDELCQLFPIGDWQSLANFPTLAPKISNIGDVNQTVTKLEIHNIEESSITSNNSIRKEPTSFKEFKFEKNIKIEVDYQELEKKYQNENAPIHVKTATDEIPPEFKENIEKTVIAKAGIHKSPSEVDLDKTIIIPSKASLPVKQLIEEGRNEKGRKLKDEEKEEDIPEKIPTIEELINEKTEVVNLALMLPAINAQISVSEAELDQKAKIEENNELIRLKDLQELMKQSAEEDEYEEEEDDDFNPNDLQPELVLSDDDELKVVKSVKKKRKKGMSLIAVMTFIGIFYFFLMPEEKAAISGPIFLNIKFPITKDYEDKPGAIVDLNNGRDHYAKGTYMGRALAAQSYLQSLEKQFMNNSALGELILTYSELLDNSKEPKIAANNIYKLIQLSENKMLSDLNVVTGTSLFFDKIGKYQTGVHLIKNYLRTKKPISAKLLTYYLDLLINSGDLVEARKTFTKLIAIPKKSFETYFSLAHFYEVDDKKIEAQALIDEGLKNFPNSVLLLLKKADYLMADHNDDKYEEVLNKINRLNSENSPQYTAKFYYHMGLLSALKKKTPEATTFFKKSLNIKESEELRSMLSSLEVSGDKFSQSLILESKVLELIKKAKEELKNKNFEAAFSFSIEAADANPDYVPAILLQTQLQLRRGLFDSAITTLQRAIASNPGNYSLSKNLATALMKAYKFEDAQKTLVMLGQTKYSRENEFATLMGDFYVLKNNIPLAMRWFSEALSRNPLNDYDMFQMAKIYVRIKKFNEAKNILAKAILLDPQNPEYLSLNAEIIFEQDNTDTAIGYLRDTISEMGEDPKLLSSIASFYYKSGQIKEFNNYYKRVQELPKKDEAFYEFLIYAARLEEKTSDYINYSRELLKLNPGNLKVRLDLGEFFYDLKRYPEAILEFNEVKDKLNSYPRVHYLLAKVYLAMFDVGKAKAMALKELELNPNLDAAYFIVGEVARIERDYREDVLKFEKAISLNPKSIDALMAMAWIRLAQNYANESVELYNRALKEDRNNPEIHKQMGFAYKAAGQRALAKEKFEDYLKLSPGASDKDQIELHIKNLQ
jgi:tetratricopeptide (TPR) repeat protein